MGQNNPWHLQLKYNQYKLLNKAQIISTQALFSLSQGHSKLTPVNSWHSKTLPNMLQNKKNSIISYKAVDN